VSNVENEVIHVACPCCRNKRLFDLMPGAIGIIQIKCPICRGVVAVSLHNYGKEGKTKIHTEQIGA